MKNHKIFILLELVLGGMAVVLALLMLTADPDASVGKVAVILPDSDSSRWASLRYGLKMAAADYNVEVVVTDTGETMTAAKQKKFIDQEVANGADAVIVGPAVGEEETAMLAKIEQELPVVMIGSAPTSNKSSVTSVAPDNLVMGQALAEELLQDYAGDLEGKTLGIICEETDDSKEEGFETALADKGVVIKWRCKISDEMKKDGVPEALAPVDLVAALDDKSVAAYAESHKNSNLKNAVAYGIAHSTEAVYYLDTGLVKALIVPDIFSMGYLSVGKATQLLQFHLGKIDSKTVAYQVLRGENLFTEDNQKLLFTMNQN
ncbi:sugar ABC transporter substrate-binding protein [Enterococcus sp. AD013-P3]|uniref:sugar ABC transporter substrate-binding protein n=1 Tax=Enterococcus sp. AD013-P3 TaxID=3411036 RepID=UPI003B94D440